MSGYFKEFSVELMTDIGTSNFRSPSSEYNCKPGLFLQQHPAFTPALPFVNFILHHPTYHQEWTSMPSIDQRLVHARSLGPLPTIAEQLAAVLTPKLTALVCGFRDPKALARYGSRDQAPRPELEQRIRFVYQIVSTLLAGGLPPEGVQAWFTGLNPDLDDHSPADLLRSEDKEKQRDVLNAARAYAEVYDMPSVDEAAAAQARPHTGVVK
jgi:hypothetical protein